MVSYIILNSKLYLPDSFKHLYKIIPLGGERGRISVVYATMLVNETNESFS